MTDKINCFGEANVFDFMDDNQKEIFKKNKGDMGDTNVTKETVKVLNNIMLCAKAILYIVPKTERKTSRNPQNRAKKPYY